MSAENATNSASKMEGILIILGMTSGIMINYRRFVIAGISGPAGALGIVGFTMLYISWREWYAFVETIIMLSIGMIPGIAVFNFLSAKFPSKANL